MEQQAEQALSPLLADFLALSAVYLLGQAAHCAPVATPMLDDARCAATFRLPGWHMDLVEQG